MKKLCGIYKIENIENDAVYIGQATDIKKRWSWHLANLRNGKHPKKELQEGWNNNISNIKFEILEECNKIDLKEREQYWIDYCKRADWNIINANKAGSNPIHIQTKEQYRKQRNAQKWYKNGNARLSKDDMVELKRMCMEGYKLVDIAKKFGVSASYVSNVKAGKRLRYLRV